MLNFHASPSNDWRFFIFPRFCENMPVSKKRKKPAATHAQARHKKQLYLPIAKAEADLLCVQARLTFETVRQGKGDRTAALNMACIALLCEALTEDGNGLLPLDFVRQVREGAFETLDTRDASEPSFSDTLIEGLGLVVNEYDRQVRETRLQAFIAASDKVDRVLENRLRVRARDQSSEISPD